MNKKFTLIEVLVVVAIIGIIASMLLPALGNARKTSQRVLCINNLKQNSSMLFMYTDDNDQYLPGIVQQFFTHPLVLDGQTGINGIPDTNKTNLPYFLKDYSNHELHDTVATFICPSSTANSNGDTESIRIKHYNADGKSPELNTRVFGKANGSVISLSITEVPDPLETPLIYDVFVTPSRTDVTLNKEPQHGYKGSVPLRTELNLSGAAKVSLDYDSLN